MVISRGLLLIASQEKDRWCKVIIEILEMWKNFAPKKWKIIVKNLLKIKPSEFLWEIGVEMGALGITRLFEWIGKK